MEDAQIWLGLNGQRFGPYTQATVQRWQQQGALDTGTLCWREGMIEWVPLDRFLRDNAGAGTGVFGEPPSFDVPPPGLTPRASVATVAARDDVPVAPSLHWGWVALLSVVTLGIFALIWMFVQSTWVRKIDPRSSATTYLIVGVVCGLSGGFVGPDSQVYFLLQLVNVVLVVMGYFSMSASIKRFGAERGLPVDIGGVTLFFFTLWYMQGQLTRIANWQRTGVVEDAPKGIFWAIYAVLVVLLIVLVVAAVQLFR
ncbi:MAG TPA: GYF domain-containing protein [Luteibacter sp.]|uniref:GYF domain-containing protein n=1 Tax=Luteibacter sp. TaxID=1886636 RepID=UPI002B59C6B1|nr:GYF domain-containing protein [Luteibacter sp.]HVI57148.1 GYF domain-containing protein [Luteibacter sp.]